MKFIYAITLFAGTCAGAFGATEFWFTRGIESTPSMPQTASRNFSALSNWSTKSPASPYYNVNPAKTLPTNSSFVRLAPNSALNGNSAAYDANNRYMNLISDAKIGKFEITAYGGIPTKFTGEKTLIFNTAKVDNGSTTDIINKTCNYFPFTFFVNISIAAKSSSTATTIRIMNSSDCYMTFSGDLFSVEGSDVSSTTPTVQIIAKTRTQSGTQAYECGDIIVESQIDSLAAIYLMADSYTNQSQSAGTIWLKGSKSNTGIFYADAARVYLDKDPGVYAISSKSTVVDNKNFVLMNRAHVTLMRDNQIAPNIQVQFGVPNNLAGDNSLVSGILDLNGYNQRIGRIYFNKRDLLVSSGIVGVLDYGNGGAQNFICSDLSYYSRYLTVSATWLEIHNYKLGEDHFYCQTRLFAKTALKSMIRFKGFGVFGVDYTVSETAVKVGGENMYEYKPAAL